MSAGWPSVVGRFWALGTPSGYLSTPWESEGIALLAAPSLRLPKRESEREPEELVKGGETYEMS